jgi:hypothetical protein
MARLRTHMFAIVLLALFTCATSAAEKDQYNLFNRTPANLMRELQTDRPSKTEDPHTVDAGHLQLESELVGYVYDDTDARTDAWSFMLTNLRLGLLNNTELSVIVEPFKWERSKSDGDEEKHEGFGTTTIRIKQNIWGNEGDAKTALALMPYLSLPTSQDELGIDQVEGGLIIPFEWEITDKTTLGLMTEANYLEDTGGDGYHFDSVLSAVVTQKLTDKFSIYGELYGEINWEEASDIIATFDTGFTYQLTDNIQLDAGVNLGLTDSAEDVNPFVGISMRF